MKQSKTLIDSIDGSTPTAINADALGRAAKCTAARFPDKAPVEEVLDELLDYLGLMWKKDPDARPLKIGDLITTRLGGEGRVIEVTPSKYVYFKMTKAVPGWKVGSTVCQPYNAVQHLDGAPVCWDGSERGVLVAYGDQIQWVHNDGSTMDGVVIPPRDRESKDIWWVTTGHSGVLFARVGEITHNPIFSTKSKIILKATGHRVIGVQGEDK